MGLTQIPLESQIRVEGAPSARWTVVEKKHPFMVRLRGEGGESHWENTRTIMREVRAGHLTVVTPGGAR